jgi:RNA polymerase sigma-70 factor (ECF subfamily)
MGDTDQTLRLLKQASLGNAEALDDLFQRHRDRLARMVRLRLDRHLKGRVDESDVLQETHLEAWRRLPKYFEEPEPMPFFLWLRFLTGQKIAELHRRHVGAQRRDVRREVRIQSPAPGPDSVTLVNELMGNHTAPSEAAARAELHKALLEALDGMEPMDRGVLTLRHFELLTNAEAAAELGISEAAATKRHQRAALKLKGLLGDLE